MTVLSIAQKNIHLVLLINRDLPRQKTVLDIDLAEPPKIFV